ncbi:MAG: 30S ribosome-binding factor RbfA [Microbacteriaceae bacterium]
MADVARARRLAERIKVLIAESLDRVVKDPDLGMVTITDVRVTPDLAHATVFYSVYGSPADIQRSREIITRNTGRIRKEVGSHLQIRVTPTLEFLIDEVPVNAAHLSELLAEAKARDAEVAKLAADAKFAGDENPYREPKSEEEDE